MVKSRFFLPNILNFYMKYNNCVILTELATRMFNLLSNVYVLSTYQVLATCTNCVCRLPRQDLSHSDLWHIQQSHVKTCTQPQTIRWTSHKRYGGLLPNVTGKYINIESCGKFQTLHTTSSILNLLVNCQSKRFIPYQVTLQYYIGIWSASVELLLHIPVLAQMKIAIMTCCLNFLTLFITMYLWFELGHSTNFIIPLPPPW